MKKRMTLAMAALLSALFGTDAALTEKPQNPAAILPLPVQKENYPPDARPNPFKETAPAIVPTAAETAAQMLIFSRPLTEPVWAETRPQAHERITRLASWGAEGQFVTLNLAVYPLKDLKNLRIEARGCKVMPEIRLVRYWDVIYPSYLSFVETPSKKQYRRMPEFLVPSNGCDKVTALEPQRFLLTFRLPADGTKALQGDVILSHDGFDKALRIPFSIRILPFTLKQDPSKHYSAYYYQVRNPWNSFYRKHKNDTEKVHRVQVQEFTRMREYGFNHLPLLNAYIEPQNAKDVKIRIPHFAVLLAELREAGFPQDAKLPLHIAGYKELYEHFTGHKLDNFHMDNIECERIPEELYAALGTALDGFLVFMKKNNAPELFCNPIDEPSIKSFPYVKRIYELFKARKLTTFLTSPPSQFQSADHLFDIYNYSSFSVPYETARSGRKQEYWCYPNDNAYQIKDPAVMCHGGRITYGLGFWRSGFHCLIPWHWRAHSSRRVASSGGNLMLEDGTLLMTVYWECFRLGVDDLRYIYTLQDAVVKRENSQNPDALKAVAEAKALLQKLWNAIPVQNAYLRDNLIPHHELDAWRSALADMILKIQKYPETNRNTAPSVIIDLKGHSVPPAERKEKKNVITREFRKWHGADKEITLRKIENGYEATVRIDHENDGSSSFNGKYPIGWPRMYAAFDWKQGIDFTKYACIEFDLTVKSDRNIASDYKWPLHFGMFSCDQSKAHVRFSLRLEPGVKHKIRIPVAQFAALSRKSLKHINLIQFVIHERSYPHGTILNLKFENLRAVGYTSPVIAKIDSPAELALPVAGFSVPALVEGVPDGTEAEVICELISDTGKKVAESKGVVIGGKTFCGFSGEELIPGNYTLRMRIPGEKKGAVQDELKRKIHIFNSPSVN